VLVQSVVPANPMVTFLDDRHSPIGRRMESSGPCTGEDLGMWSRFANPAWSWGCLSSPLASTPPVPRSYPARTTNPQQPSRRHRGLQFRHATESVVHATFVIGGVD